MSSVFSNLKRRGTTNGRHRSTNSNATQSSDSFASATEPSPDSNGSDGSAQDISSTEYARRCRELMELNRALRELGSAIFAARRLLKFGEELIFVGGVVPQGDYVI